MSVFIKSIYALVILRLTILKSMHITFRSYMGKPGITIIKIPAAFYLGLFFPSKFSMWILKFYADGTIISCKRIVMPKEIKMSLIGWCETVRLIIFRMQIIVADWFQKWGLIKVMIHFYLIFINEYADKEK